MDKRKLIKAVKRVTYLPKNKYLLFYMVNKLVHLFYRLTRSTKVAYPSTIMLELTNHCNLHCTTCPREYAYGKKMDKGYIDFEKAKTIIDEIWPYLDSIGLTGMGETFMYTRINEIVEYIHSKNKGIIISLSTNAMIPDFIQRVKPVINKVDTIQISIDGLNDVYEAIRINADFALFHNNVTQLVKLCKETDTVLLFNMVVTQENYHHMYPSLEYAQKAGIRYVRFSLFNLAAVTDIDVDYYSFYKSDQFLREYTRVRNAKKNFKEIEVTYWDFNSKNEFKKCLFPWTHFYICWNGYIPPCCAKPFPKELHFGDVFNSGVMNILNGKPFRKFRKLWYMNQAPDFCRKCHYINFEPIEEQK